MDFPKVALIPILSDARGVQLIVKKWERKKRLPDAIVIEHPRLAGGHLGAARVADLGDTRFDFENVLPQSRASASTRLKPSLASPSTVTAKGVPSCTPAAPSDCNRAMSSQLRMPPAAISGISRSMPALRT